jgi:hypothetical protein
MAGQEQHHNWLFTSGTQVGHSALNALKHPGKVANLAVAKFKENFLWERYYQSIPGRKTKAWIPHDPRIHQQVTEELHRSGYDVRPYRIDISDLHGYLARANYANYPTYYRGGKSLNFAEKSLEHYLATKFLDLSREDIFMDVANAGAPVPEIYRDLFGCTAYRQDLVFPAGIKDEMIGGDAAKMPVPDGFATKMSLHCSFEHFEQTSDIEFIREANRVLQTAGRLVILPLYLFNEYAIQTDPVALPKGSNPFDPQARIYCARGYGNRHGRFYSIPQFTARIRENLGRFRLTLYVVQNEHEVSATCYIKFIAVLEKMA